MKYSVTMEGKDEGFIVTEDGGVATFFYGDGKYVLSLYQTRIDGFDPNNGDHWDTLSEGKMYMIESPDADSIEDIAIDWLAPFSAAPRQRVEFEFLNMPKDDYRQKYEDLLAEFEQYKRESIKWSVDDFLEHAPTKYTITEEQAQLALEDMISEHDACLGITWETIRYYTAKYGNVK